MFNSKKSHVKFGKPNSISPVNDVKSWWFDSDDEEKDNKKYNSSKKTSFERALVTLELNTNPFDDTKKSPSSSTYAHQSSDQNSKKSSSTMYAGHSADRTRYKNNFRDSGGLENQSVQELELESYAVYNAEETTESVHNCLKIAENIRQDATKTLVTLHHQGEKITRSHQVAADIDRDLNDPVRRKGNHLEQREKLGLTSASKGQSKLRTPPREPTAALEKVEFEKEKQDNALSNFSDLLVELKDMAADMGSEFERHNKALSHLEDDVDELNF